MSIIGTNFVPCATKKRKTLQTTKILHFGNAENWQMIFPDDYLNKIICNDSLTVMRQMPDSCYRPRCNIAAV